MKIKHFLIGMLAVVAAVACKQEEPVVEPVLEVNKTAVALTATAAEGAFEVTANNAWSADADADWVSLNPANGDGGEKAVTVKVTADDNTAEARTATVTVKSGKLTKTVKVSQAAAETSEAPVEPEKETAQLVTFLSFTSNVASGQNTVTVQLAAEGLSMEPVTSEWGTYDQLVGAGKYLKFDAYSADGTLAAGTYNASAVGGTVNEGEFSIGYDTTVDWGFGPMEMTNWGTCWMTHNADGSETGVKVTDGTLTVAVEGDVYTITLESSVLNATYVGKLSKDTTGGEEPEQPELEVSTWALVGSFNGWDAAGSTAFLSVLDADYFVYYGFEVGADTEFKFVKDGKWASQGGAEIGGNGLVQPNTIQAAGGSNIKVTEAGKYDIYLAADLSKFYIMSEGKLPSEATEPAPVENTWGMMGCFVDNTWAKDVPMTKEGEWIVAKGAQFTELTFKIRANESWADATNIGLAPGSAKGEINTKVSVVTAEYAKANLGGDAADIKLNGEAGTYDVYFSYENLEVYVMTPGLKPGETPAAPVDVDIDDKQWVFTWSPLNAPFVIDLGVTEPGLAILAFDMAALDPEYAGIYYPYMICTYEITKTDGTSGVVALTDIDYGETINIPYSNATENSVHFESEALLEENIDCTLATSKIDIYMESAEFLADGEYWIIAGDKVATPLTGNYGYLQVTDAVDGRSTAANAFTFTQVEEGLYTIQDSNGKYYYQTGTYNSFNISATDGGTDEYLWEVYDTGNGQFAIINYEVGKYIQYDTQYNSYGSYMEERGVLPTLVLAENPVTEPEPTPGEGLAHPLTSNIEWTLGTKAYSDKATINGNADVSVLKLGTSELAGDATVVIPAGTTKVGFYGVPWKGKTGTLTASSDIAGGKFYEMNFVSNAGATSTAPYTMTVSDETDYYELDVVALLGSPCPMDLPVTLSTVENAYRVIIFGLNYYTE